MNINIMVKSTKKFEENKIFTFKISLQEPIIIEHVGNLRIGCCL
jgi:hypothetical protein